MSSSYPYKPPPPPPATAPPVTDTTTPASSSGNSWPRGRGTYRGSRQQRGSTTFNPRNQDHNGSASLPSGDASRQYHRGSRSLQQSVGQKRKIGSDNVPQNSHVRRTSGASNNDKPGSAFHSNSQMNQTNSPRLARPKAPPAVPTFGFEIPVINTSDSAKPLNNLKIPSFSITKSTSRKANQLGLTPTNAPEDITDSSDEDENEDEEARFARSGELPLINYNGEAVALSLPHEIKAWIADRKRNFPTQARIAARKEAERQYRIEYDKINKERNRGNQDVVKRHELAHQEIGHSEHVDNSDEEFSPPEEIKTVKKGGNTDSKIIYSTTNQHLASKQPCKYFLRDGSCRRPNCQFSHDIEKTHNHKITLIDRLSKHESTRQHLRALELIKILGADGYFD